MSRSYKKTPVCKDTDQDNKKFANKVVRHYFDLPDGNTYRKVYNSYNIRDWVSKPTIEDFIRIIEG